MVLCVTVVPGECFILSDDGVSRHSGWRWLRSLDAPQRGLYLRLGYGEVNMIEVVPLGLLVIAVGAALTIFDIEAVIVRERCGVDELDDVCRPGHQVLEPACEVAHAPVALWRADYVEGTEVHRSSR